MKFNKLTPVIYSAGLQRTVDFNTQTFGFTCLANEPCWGWARAQLKNAGISDNIDDISNIDK